MSVTLTRYGALLHVGRLGLPLPPLLACALRPPPAQFQNKFYALGHGDAVKFEPFSFALFKEAEAEAAA